MAAPTRTQNLGGSLSAWLNSHPVLGSLATMVIAVFALLASFRVVTDLLDRFEFPNDVDRRISLEFWIFGFVAVAVIFSAGFLIRSPWWPALASAPLFVLSQTTKGPYGSSLEEAFFGWMSDFFLTSAIVTAVSATGGILLGRWANARSSRRSDAESWSSRLANGFVIFTVSTVVIAGATYALIGDSNSPTRNEEQFGQWIYGVSSNEDTIFIGTGNGIVALDAATHSVAWRFTTGEAVMLAPTVTNDRIYFGSHTTQVYAVDLQGTELWRYDMDNWVFDSPAVANGMVYVGSAAKFVALDAATGGEVWIIDFGTWVEISWSEVVDGVIYLGTAHGELLAIDAITGVEQWRFLVPTFAEATEATPGTFTPSPWIRNAPVVADGIVYFGCGDGHVYAVEAATGKERWNLDTGRSGQPNVAVDNNVVYAVTHENVYALGAQDGSAIWHVKVNGGIWYAPVVTEDLLVVSYDRVRGRLTGLDLATGETRWTYVYSENPKLYYEFTNMNVRNTQLYAGSSGQGLFALDIATGTVIWHLLNP
jgi:outer membrane protein assembly factor BamB